MSEQLLTEFSAGRHVRPVRRDPRGPLQHEPVAQLRQALVPRRQHPRRRREHQPRRGPSGPAPGREHPVPAGRPAALRARPVPEGHGRAARRPRRRRGSTCTPSASSSAWSWPAAGPGSSSTRTTSDQLRRLVHAVDVFSQGSAILDAKDPDAVRDLVRATYVEFERDFLRPGLGPAPRADRAGRGGRARRGRAAPRHPHGPAPPSGRPGARARGRRTRRPRGRDVPPGRNPHERPDAWSTRSTSSSPPTTPRRRSSGWPTTSLFAQRVVHETLRLRPTTPKIKRRAEADTTVAGRAIPKDAQVVLDAAVANQDPALVRRAARPRSTPTGRSPTASRAGACRSGPAPTSAPGDRWPAGSRSRPRSRPTTSTSSASSR